SRLLRSHYSPGMIPITAMAPGMASMPVPRMVFARFDTQLSVDARPISCGVESWGPSTSGPRGGVETSLRRGRGGESRGEEEGGAGGGRRGGGEGRGGGGTSGRGGIAHVAHVGEEGG